MLAIVAGKVLELIGRLGNGSTDDFNFAVVDRVVLNSISYEPEEYDGDVTHGNQLILYREYPETKLHRLHDDYKPPGFHIAQYFTLENLEGIDIVSEDGRTKIVFTIFDMWNSPVRYELNTGDFCHILSDFDIELADIEFLPDHKRQPYICYYGDM